MATRPPDTPLPLGSGAERTCITLDLLPDGRVRIMSVCVGRRDAVYVPMLDARVPTEVCKLLQELRKQLAGSVNP